MEVLDEAQTPALFLLLLELGQQADMLFKVDRPPVIGINQSEIPKLRPLVKIRDSRNRDLKKLLGEGVECSVVGNLPKQTEEVGQERVVSRWLGDGFNKAGASRYQRTKRWQSRDRLQAHPSTRGFRSRRPCG